ncbi:MAG: ankyrin repeat domain-containing protein [Proteobacteria bacterium]|nr:ankyrin repeat domain-containing protein [Pseudomonadota bacterium]
MFWKRCTVNDVIEEMRYNAQRGNGMKLPRYDTVHGETYLHVAARWSSNPNVITYLVENGYKLTARDQYGRQPLHYAYKNEKAMEIIPTMLRLGADPDALDNYKNWPSMSAPKAKYDAYERATAGIIKELKRREGEQCPA